MPLLCHRSQRIARSIDLARGAEPDQDHLLLQLAAAVKFGTDLVIKVEKLLEGLVFRGHNKSNNVHEQGRHRVSVEHDGQDALHGLDLGLIGPLLQLIAQVGHGWDVGRIVLVDKAVGVLQKTGHFGGVTGGYLRCVGVEAET